MTSSANKESLRSTYPKILLSIVSLGGGLALFLLLASSVLVSQPIGSTLRGYFYGVGSSQKFDSDPSVGHLVSESNLSISRNHGNEVTTSESESGEGYGKETIIGHNLAPGSLNKNETSTLGPLESGNLRDLTKEDHEDDPNRNPSSSITALSRNETVLSNNSMLTGIKSPESSPVFLNTSQPTVVDSGCDLYHGDWIYDSAGPLYTNSNCPIITPTQNCQGNGRPDKDYENWRWKPSQCELPRFDAKKFLELMRGKTLAFVGDSVARNQFESMLCILWQVEVPINRGNKKMQRYIFMSTQTILVRIWSSWLVHQTPEAFKFAPSGVIKLHLDVPDENLMEQIPGFDVVVLSSGHWFAKQSVYILNNEIVGGQLWWPDKSREMKIDNTNAFGVSVETILTAMGTHPNYTGLTIVRSFSPDHYEGGAWNTGGSCTGKVKPTLKGELVENGFTNIMHEKQVTGFSRAINKRTNKSKMILMDITEAFSYRHDAHPGPYRNQDPNKITKRDAAGRPPPQDCLHWCMPGAIDTWNELISEIIRKEFQGKQI